MQYLLAIPVLFFKRLGFLTFIFLIFVCSAEAKIQISQNVEPERREAIVNDIREKTGLVSLAADENNVLFLKGLNEILGGSETMRSLILGAIEDMENTFLIQDYSRSARINFSQTDQGTVNVETGKTRYIVGFDFDDFEKSRRYSSDEALGSFSLGINLFHEIDHKVSYDPTDPIPESGVRPDKSSERERGVIENTNLVREELGLIARDPKSKFGIRYRGLVSQFRNTLQILFRNKKGKRRFLRWRS